MRKNYTLCAFLQGFVTRWEAFSELPQLVRECSAFLLPKCTFAHARLRLQAVSAHKKKLHREGGALNTISYLGTTEHSWDGAEKSLLYLESFPLPHLHAWQLVNPIP